MKKLLVVMVLALAGCGGESDTIATKVQAGILKSCSFAADYTWLRAIVVKLDVSNAAAAIDKTVDLICNGVTASEPQGLMSGKTPCKNGEIIVEGERICIKGAPVKSK